MDFLEKDEFVKLTTKKEMEEEQPKQEGEEPQKKGQEGQQQE